MTGTLRGKTLAEKRYGPGIRPNTTAAIGAVDLRVCRAEGCAGRPIGTIEIWVDDPPPAVDWYTKMMRHLPSQAWTTAAFCMAHMPEVIRRSVDELDEPDQWAPWRNNPTVMTHPPKVAKPELLLPKSRTGVE